MTMRVSCCGAEVAAGAPAAQQSAAAASSSRRMTHSRTTVGTTAHGYSPARTTFTVTSVVTSRWRRTVTLCSPSVRIGSSSWILRRSMVKLLASSASATSFAVTDPKS